ncbi:hypothetical protein EUAN_22580 [Andreesenia angusta]|uniref:Uncharacterized protein n=1 Tax=Andreesenia angusta TaxID=39480 RepID=A0A1S1V4G1_9FIRM|nr:hypothetical protein [Andreesenia angusta]OHW61408.1 hypothetical protein EUAN_22580 [Andreesenia angusta]
MDRLKYLLDEYDRALDDTAKDILEKIKAESKTYGDVEKSLDLLKKSMSYTFGKLRYERLFEKIDEILEEEKNDLPLTNRSKL